MALQLQQVRLAALSRNPVRWLIGTGAVAILVIVLATALAISSFRDRALESSQRELENTVVTLTRHFEQEFYDLKRVANSIGTQLQLQGVVTPQQFALTMPTHDQHRILKSQVSAPTTGRIDLIDAGGNMINSSGIWPTPTVDVRARAFFQTLKAGMAEADQEIVASIHSRVTDAWMTLFARRLSGPNGEFLGLVTRSVEPRQFQDFFASILPGRDATILMLHRDGTLLARYPEVPGRNGQVIRPNGTFESVRPDRPATLRTISPFDGKERLTSVWRLSEFPIVLVATVAVDTALADWRAQTRLLVGAALLLMLVFTALLVLIIRQIRRQHAAAQARLNLEKHRLDTAINNMTQGLLMFDAEARAVVVNQSYTSMYHMAPGDIAPGTSLHDTLAYHLANKTFGGDVPADLDAFCAQIIEANKTSQSATMNLPDGRVIQRQSQPIVDGGWLTLHEDITERHHVEERISHLAHYDALTDLPNRTLFHELVSNELAHIARGQSCAVLYIDMDEFKSINDSLGHSVGDALLRAVAQRLKSCVRSGDVVARLGGDEFAIVHVDLQSDNEVIDLVTRIQAAIREPLECLGHSLFTDVSIGIALAPRDGTDLDSLLKNADLAMYSAKADGRRTHRFFAPEMDARVQAQRLLEHDLRHAIADGGFAAGGFEVQYQPLLRLDDDTVSGCEALLRWRHPLRGMISPAEFIPVAENIGVINTLGEWVLGTACREAATWPGNVKIAVNVSPVQFRSPTLAMKVAAALAESGLSAQRLELEITEAVLIRDDGIALAVLHQLRSLGVRIALDDFGTGYSSLSYLQRFPFDKIKIDRAFVTDIVETGGSSSIVQAVVNIAASRNMSTTAEGVETEAQKALLRALGCTEMQGYLFSAAKPASEIRTLIAAHGNSSSAAA